jgi:soluble lytic murein transglycosylase
LHKAGLRRDAAAFIAALSDTLHTPDEYLLLADLAVDVGNYKGAIQIAEKALNKNIYLLDHAYPTILSSVGHVDQEWALVHAVIHQESAFDSRAVSSAGARGYMQLMPATAREVARKNHKAHSLDWLISKPRHNISLGAAYLQQMIMRYDGSYALALAAYNGGPGRVDRWLETFGDPRKDEIDILDWIELIPVYETRNYVQRVLENIYVYRIKLEGIQSNASAPIHVAFLP